MDATKVLALFLGILVIFAVCGVMKITASLFIPLILSILLSFVLAPAVNFLERKHVPRILGIIIVLLIVIGCCYLLSLLVFATFNSFLLEFPKYQQRFENIYKDIETKVFENFSFSTTDMLLDVDWGEIIRGSLFALSGNFIDFFKSLAMIVIFLIFILLEHPHFREKVETAFPSPMSDRIAYVVGHITLQIGRYLTLKLGISLATGICVWLALEIIGMDFALLWGFVALLLNFIPNIGSLIVIVITIMMGIVQFYPDGYHMAAVVVSMVTIQVVIGNIIDPRLQGSRLNLSPLFILISLLLWGWIWGIMGMFLAVPITVIIKIACENIPVLRPISVLIGSGKYLTEEGWTLKKVLDFFKKKRKTGK